MRITHRRWFPSQWSLSASGSQSICMASTLWIELEISIGLLSGRLLPLHFTPSLLSPSLLPIFSQSSPSLPPSFPFSPNPLPLSLSSSHLLPISSLSPSFLSYLLLLSLPPSLSSPSLPPSFPIFSLPPSLLPYLCPPSPSPSPHHTYTTSNTPSAYLVYRMVCVFRMRMMFSGLGPSVILDALEQRNS